MDYRHKLKEVKQLHEASKLLLEKLDEIFESPEYTSVFTFAHVHGFEYRGKTCRNELEHLRHTLKELVI